MSRDTYIANYVQKALLDAAMELWKDDTAAGMAIFKKGLDPKFKKKTIRDCRQEYISKFYVRNGSYFIRYVAVLPDGTEEELRLFGVDSYRNDSLCNERITVSWDDIPLLEDLSQKAVMIEQAFELIDYETMDELKKKHPWLLKFFDAAYESWRVTYRAVEAFASN